MFGKFIAGEMHRFPASNENTIYADDLVILSESPTGLQHCINALDNYCEKWRLNINIKKTKALKLKGKQKLTVMHTYLILMIID